MTLFRPNDSNSNTYARFPTNIRTNILSLTSSNYNASTNVLTSNLAGSVLGYRIESISVTNDDTKDNNLLFYLQEVSSPNLSTLPIAFCSITAGSGTDYSDYPTTVLSSTAFSSFTLTDNNGNLYLPMDLNYKLIVKSQLAPSTAKTIQIYTTISDY